MRARRASLLVGPLAFAHVFAFGCGHGATSPAASAELPTASATAVASVSAPSAAHVPERAADAPPPTTAAPAGTMADTTQDPTSTLLERSQGLNAGPAVSGGLGGSTKTQQTPNGPRANVSEVTLSVSGHPQADVVKKALRARVAALRSCYQHALLLDPTAKGRSSVKLVVDKTGVIQSVTDQKSTFTQSETLTCIVTRYSRFRMPEADEGYEVTHVLSFLPQN